VWGAARPSAYDCSGLVLAAYRSAGVWLPRVSGAQWHAWPRVGLAELAPGDLVFFAHDPGDPSTIHHVGMYVGGGAMVEAPIPGPRYASPRSAVATTPARSARPAGRLERS
jgi:peptidoglycan DL-endopeptidase CwlO